MRGLVNGDVTPRGSQIPQVGRGPNCGEVNRPIGGPLRRISLEERPRSQARATCTGCMRRQGRATAVAARIGLFRGEGQGAAI